VLCNSRQITALPFTISAARRHHLQARYKLMSNPLFNQLNDILRPSTSHTFAPFVTIAARRRHLQKGGFEHAATGFEQAVRQRQRGHSTGT
jgi:hypothetical protein